MFPALSMTYKSHEIYSPAGKLTNILNASSVPSKVNFIGVFNRALPILVHICSEPTSGFASFDIEIFIPIGNTPSFEK